jgi:uncharacterized integral membrane protein
MSHVEPPRGGGAGEKRSTRETLRLAGIIALIAYGVIVILLNGKTSTINLLFWKVDMPLWVALVLFAAIGFALGWLMSHRSRQRGK